MDAAASWDSSASLRTSSATTANPRPCSPARAASIAALSARRFVWPAIPVIVATIPPICSDFAPSWCIASVTCAEDSRTWRIACVAWATACSPASATSRAWAAASAVSCADSADVRVAADLLGGLLGGLDRPHLALGALGDVAHRRRDLADRAAGLLGGGGHLLRRGREEAGVALHRAHELAQRLDGGVVRQDRVDDAFADRVERPRHLAQLVLLMSSMSGVTGVTSCVRSPSARARTAADRSATQWSRSMAKALDDDLDRARDGTGDDQRERDAEQQGDDARDEDRAAGGRAGGERRVGALLQVGLDLLLDLVDGASRAPRTRGEPRPVLPARDPLLDRRVSGVRPRH